MSTIADAEVMALFSRWRVGAETYRLKLREHLSVATPCGWPRWHQHSHRARDLASLLDNRIPTAAGEDG